MRGRWGGAVVGIGLVGCLIGGCTGQPDAGGGIPPSASRSPSTGATVGAPTRTTAGITPKATPTKVILPPAATAHTEDGAKAFIAFFVDQMSKSAHEADSSTMAQLSGPRCRGCKTLIDYADELKAKGQHVDRESVRLHGQIVFPDSTADRYIIDALIESQPSKVVDFQGRTVSNDAGEKFTLRNTVSWSAGAWVMSDNLMVMN
jgi:hypothetical protein